jgi:hypothetical protein
MANRLRPSVCCEAGSLEAVALPEATGFANELGCRATAPSVELTVATLRPR